MRVTPPDDRRNDLLVFALAVGLVLDGYGRGRSREDSGWMSGAAVDTFDPRAPAPLVPLLPTGKAPAAVRR